MSLIPSLWRRRQGNLAIERVLGQSELHRKTISKTTKQSGGAIGRPCFKTKNKSP